MSQPSPEEYDEHLTDGEGSNDEELDPKQTRDASQTSPSSASNATAGNASVVKPLHLQKRRRVTRACDECRRKKIKCDGKQPCTHCTVYSYDCTYDQPSNRRRNPAPQYVENLEHRVHRAETLLHILIPNLDLNDPGIDAAVAQGWIPGAPGRGDPVAKQQPGQQPIQLPQRTQQLQQSTTVSQNQQNLPNGHQGPETHLHSMVRAVAQMDMDEQGHWDYHGHSSGLSFVRRMREQVGSLMGPDTVSTPFVKTRPMSQLLDSPRSGAASPAEMSPGGTDLPPREYARQYCSNAVDDAAALLRVVHKPTFWQSFERLYNISPDNYTNDDNIFLPLFHSAMALGHLFAKDEQSTLSQHGYENAIQQGFTHFKIARQMMDVCDCRDLTSIQAVVMMILFLQSSAKLSQCYAYVGVALRAALRMGLHRAYVGQFNPLEAETRKRVFWVVRKMDIYVGAMLGLPQTLSDEDIDQELPLEVDDEYVTTTGVEPMPEGTVSLMTAFNSHTRLVQILSKIVRKIYPIKTPSDTPDKSYSIPFSVIRELEDDLESWKQSLPAVFNSSTPGVQPQYKRIQQLLRLAYAHAQIMLYRPFLHFVCVDKRSQGVEGRAYACGASYVNVSRNMIHITSHMKREGLLNGAYWFVMYTSFFAIMSLIYYAAENQENPTTQAVIKDALEGRQTLAELANRSMAADRCTATLNSVFAQLPAWMQEGQQNPMLSRKRQHDASSSSLTSNTTLSRSQPDVSIFAQAAPNVGAKRASTFPKHGQQIAMPQNSYTQSWNGTAPFGAQTPTGSFDAQMFGRWNEQQSSTAMSNGVHGFQLPENISTPDLPDLSAMMYPTADEPFAYPNQPLTTFESNPQYSRGNSLRDTQMYTVGESASAMAASSSRSHEDSLEANYLALPPYIDQKQAPQYRQQGYGLPPEAVSNYTNGGPMGVMTATSMANGMANGTWPNHQAQSHNMPNINIQEIFGGAEWIPGHSQPGFQS
ncbi:hypothetical protein EJ03DRAFT_371615 [Teratosphaeria nubilosa]|uniref:Zn(2)-C6 fungal-type domain-containing protein n=1 Tax=Teratosphaeria nubilosa TaxID=161662 RepID=A0A6G1LLZ9_9PEZI|nr:hypothetical protein EJ03DRAFT_371615 [Teratosphaeria nubilosa]